ncbi:hypothetical protein ACFYV7_15075 [Nocardia suismassiliense]|uniref:XRE family transcriptional regulator n=1 Tax=Nocardia suismassiliense TaxID=2077092 RepID=A0ABW6QSV3_9NOCA
MTAESGPNYRLAGRIAMSGWTHDFVADLVNAKVEVNTGKPGDYRADSIGRLVRGIHTWPHTAYREALCEVFDCTPDALGFKNPRAKRNLGHVDHEEFDVRRWDFLRSLVAIPAVAAMPGEVLDAAVEPIEKAVVPTRVGIEHVSQVNAWAALFRAADDAGLSITEGMAAQLRVAASYQQADASPQVAAALRIALATFYRVVGWAHYDRGEHQRARSRYDEGWTIVEESGEWWLRAAILTCMARQAIYLDHADVALNMLGLASVRADQLSDLRRADVAAVKARAFGKLGNDRECLRAVLEAEQFYTDGQGYDHPDTEHEGFALYYTENLLNSDLAHGLFELAFRRGIEVPRTVDRLRAALNLSDEHARSRLLCTASLAALQLRHGDVDEGIELARYAVKSATGTTSARLIKDIQRIHHVTGDDRITSATGVVELRQEASELLRTL